MNLYKALLPQLAGILILAFGVAGCSNLPLPLENPDSEQTLAAREIAIALTETTMAMNLQPSPEMSVTPTEEPPPLESETPLPPPTQISHTILPGDPGWVVTWLNDTRSTNFANEHRAPGGDDLSINLIERPFTQLEMDYRPDLDIHYTELSMDDTFYYVKVFLAGSNPESNDLSGAAYGVELDMDLDGRGDYLVWAGGPCDGVWDIEGMVVFSDPNNDVGASRAILRDAPTIGDGYNQEIFSLDQLQDPDAAWCRQNSSNEIQIAFKKSMINNPQFFLFGVWADAGVRGPSLFDYNDFFTAEQAGSPISGQAQYPIKDLYLVDNTCREAYGFEPIGNEPGICPRPEPTVTNTIEPTFTPTPETTETPIIEPSITPTKFFIIPIPTITRTPLSITS